MEYLRKPYPGKEVLDGNDAVICHNHYFQNGAYFIPHIASGYMIAGHLKHLKEKLAKELKEDGDGK